MRRLPYLLSALLALVLGTTAWAQYGDISDLKLAKPEDKVDVKPVPPPAGALVLFDGKSPASWKLLDDGVMEVQGGNIMTRENFDGHFKLHVEFRVPYRPDKKGQERGNSGVYVQGLYEVQVLDSYGLESKKDDCGAIYGISAPKENACKAPTVWQSYDIDFQAARCEDGKVTVPARMTVHQNGVLIQDDVEVSHRTTASLDRDPCQPGPIMLQDHGNPVQYRNIWLLQEKAK